MTKAWLKQLQLQLLHHKHCHSAFPDTFISQVLLKTWPCTNYLLFTAGPSLLQLILNLEFHLWNMSWCTYCRIQRLRTDYTTDVFTHNTVFPNLLSKSIANFGSFTKLNLMGNVTKLAKQHSLQNSIIGIITKTWLYIILTTS